MGRLDYGVTRDEALGHSEALAQAVEVPVSADLENCFADDPAGVAETIELAIGTGLAGGSIEDFTGDRSDPIYDVDEAAERVAAAAEVAHSGGLRYVLTARCENYLHGRTDLADTIARLQRYQEAGADVLYAPGVIALDEVRQLVAEVDRPVNVLPLPGCPVVSELAEVGVARISIGGAFAYAALGAVVEAARELQEKGTYDFWERSMVGGGAVRQAFKA
jgi:2-methylisocitrate lyase-like PEP mutase family enzyme